MEIVLLVGLAIAALLMALVVAVLYQLILQNGRLLLRVERIEDWLSQGDRDEYEVEEFTGMLPIGVPAPSVELPDLNGVVRSLGEWRGQRVLVVFFDPHCVFSQQLLPHLASLAAEPIPDRPTPVVITTGEIEENRLLFNQAEYTGTVLLQSGTEVAASYRIDGTPVSYLLDPDGIVASELASGVQATLILAGEIASVADATDSELSDTAAARAASSRVTRDGLRDGEVAPIFRLPRLGGGEISLLDYRGKSVVIVFTDPDCDPCDDLAPGLEAASKAEPDHALLLVSRGSEEANQLMVNEHGLTMPIALQRHWEISREYGIFATPAGFLIDEWGVVVGSVAVGNEAVIDLMKFAATASKK